MAQKTTTQGSFGYDQTIGDLKVAHALPEGSEDKWTQAALTLQGKIGNWDLTYAGAYLKRDDDTESDYADYSFFYDTCCGYGVVHVRQRRRPDRSVAVHPAAATTTPSRATSCASARRPRIAGA